ncbi:MAG: hypothetical protein WA885_05500 [Phormidesmis sp.]
MRYSPPSTVDISASPSLPLASPDEERQINPQVAASQSLGIDIFLVLVSLLMGGLFSSAVRSVNVAGDLSGDFLKPSAWLIFLVCLLPAVGCLLADVVSILSNPGALPLAQSKSRMNAIYAKRMHLLLLAFYFTAILVALCWSALSMPLISKLFVSAIFSLALYALGQSIPHKRLSFVVSGLLFLVVLIGSQTFIVLRLEADSEQTKREALGDVPPDESTSGPEPNKGPAFDE